MKMKIMIVTVVYMRLMIATVVIFMRLWRLNLRRKLRSLTVCPSKTKPEDLLEKCRDEAADCSTSKVIEDEEFR